MIDSNTLVCGCIGIQDGSRWLCPQGHEFAEAYMAGEITRAQMRSRMKAAQAQRCGA